ncbi:MAG: amidohydrolase [Candidatus Bathyarchaeota archaeon]|nr:amidohydrolase [Candidatus Bathyarchaeota archaeon]
MNILIQNGTILTMHDGKIIRQGAIAIEEEIIVDVGKTKELKRKYGRGYEKIDAKNKIVMPGFVNTHQHAAMSLLRGYADDLPLQEWLEKWIWPIEKHMTAHDIYLGALLTAVESIMGGTTTVNTMYHYTPEENEAKAFADAGLRGVIGHVCFSWRKEEDRKALWDLAKKWHNKEKGLIRVSVDPHAPYTVDPEYMEELKMLREALTEKYGLENAPIIWHIHVAETSDEKEKIQKAFNIQIKNGIMEYLDSLGVLNEKVVAAHCVALTDKDVKIMRKRDVKVSHNPISNLKLASGVSPIPKMLEKSITVSLGTDSPCSNNTTDIFETMKTTAILHKGINKNPTLLPAEKILEMATIKGAKALSWDKEIGSIAVGKKADLIIINLKKPHLSPLHNETSHMVYAAKSSDVETVIINGKIIMENRTLKTLKVKRVMELAEKAKNSLLKRVSANIK